MTRAQRIAAARVAAEVRRVRRDRGEGSVTLDALELQEIEEDARRRELQSALIGARGAIASYWSRFERWTKREAVLEIGVARTLGADKATLANLKYWLDHGTQPT